MLYFVIKKNVIREHVQHWIVLKVILVGISNWVDHCIFFYYKKFNTVNTYSCHFKDISSENILRMFATVFQNSKLFKRLL